MKNKICKVYLSTDSEEFSKRECQYTFGKVVKVEYPDEVDRNGFLKEVLTLEPLEEIHEDDTDIG